MKALIKKLSIAQKAFLINQSYWIADHGTEKETCAITFPTIHSGMVKALNKKPTMTRKIVARAITDMLMSITLPSRELKLGQNIVAPTGVLSYPQDLLLIKNPRCLELVRAFETGQDTLSGSGAENWSSLRDRMSFVVDFFRSHQQYKRMWEAPFQESQMPVIESGHFPAGPL